MEMGIGRGKGGRRGEKDLKGEEMGRTIETGMVKVEEG